METLRTFFAAPFGNEAPSLAEIHIVEPLPTPEELSEMYDGNLMDQLRAFFGDEAEKYVDFMEKHMPQGLVDAIFGVLAQRKASIFVLSKETLDERAKAPD